MWSMHSREWRRVHVYYCLWCCLKIPSYIYMRHILYYRVRIFRWISRNPTCGNIQSKLVLGGRNCNLGRGVESSILKFFLKLIIYFLYSFILIFFFFIAFTQLFSFYWTCPSSRIVNVNKWCCLVCEFLYIHLQIGKIPAPPPFIPLAELRKEQIKDRAKTRKGS